MWSEKDTETTSAEMEHMGMDPVQASSTIPGTAIIMLVTTALIRIAVKGKNKHVFLEVAFSC